MNKRLPCGGLFIKTAMLNYAGAAVFNTTNPYAHSVIIYIYKSPCCTLPAGYSLAVKLAGFLVNKIYDTHKPYIR